MDSPRLVTGSPPIAIAALVLLTALLLAVPRSAADGAENSDVLELTPANFYDHVGGDSVTFVKFYAPWRVPPVIMRAVSHDDVIPGLVSVSGSLRILSRCGHCQRLAPDWEKVATAFKDSDAIRIAKVDCQAHAELCTNHEVRGYPTLKWFPAAGQGGAEDYGGDRKANVFVDFINSRLGTKGRVETEQESRVMELTTWAFPSVMLDDTKHLFTYYYDAACKPCKEMTKTVEKLANIFKGEQSIVFAKVDADNNGMLAHRFKITEYPFFKFFTKTNKYGEDLKGDPLPTLTDLVHFVNQWTGTTQSASGVPLDKVGRIAELDAMAGSFVEAPEAEKQGLMERAMGVVVAPELEEHGVFYQKVMKNIVEQGEEYVSKEHARLSKLLAGSLKPDKVEKLSARRNILEAFSKP
ncbi:unnamed protein product [Closterium sp. NIES-65]|nr:unnamed protein product [Closterium sp. NIES-65]